MIRARLISPSCLSTLLAAPLVLLVVGCNLNTTQIEAVSPQADVLIVPSTFCIGETLTVSWDGGPQVNSCGSSRNLTDCKGAGLTVTPNTPIGLSFGFGFAEQNLNGSSSGPADLLYPYLARYYVQWEGWSSYRAYRELGPDGEWVGVVRDEAVARPLGPLDTLTVSYADTFVCDPETRTWVMGRRDHTAYVGSEVPYRYDPPGDLSACAAITGEVCIPDTYRTLGRLQVSVPGGPSVTLGTEGNPDGLPRCTTAFIGYNPEDIVITPLDTRTVTEGSTRNDYTLGAACTPDQPEWLGQSWLTYEIAGSTLCGVSETSTVPASWSSSGLEPFTFGNVQLLGVSRDRCRAALDPAFLAAYDTQFGAIPPGGGGSPGEPACSANPNDGICCAAGGETYLTSPNECPVPTAACGSPCATDAQCAGVGGNPVCAGGQCYDAAACGGQPPPPSGDTSGGDTGGDTGGSVDCSAVGQTCNLDPSFGACPADYTCGGPYDEFNYGTCQRAGCP